MRSKTGWSAAAQKHFLREIVGPIPASRGSDQLRAFVESGSLAVWPFHRTALTPAYELMELYPDHPMDLADASLAAAAEALGTRRVFTLNRRDFETYRVRRGHRRQPMPLVS